MSYVKLHDNVITSSIWAADHETFRLWIALLVRADRDGYVRGTVPGFANLCRVDVSKVAEAFEGFMLPDPYSGSQENEGRRMVRVDGGWQILNYDKYRYLASAEDQRERTAARVRRHRERLARNAVTLTVTPGNASNPIAEAEADTDQKREEISSSRGSTLTAQVREVFEFWRENTGRKNSRLDRKRELRIRARLSEKFSVEDLKQAIANRVHDPWLMGKDPKSPRIYDGIETLLRDASQVERLRDIGKGNGSALLPTFGGRF